MQRTNSYLFTVENNERGLREIANLRSMICSWNKAVSKNSSKKKLAVRARLGRNNPASSYYKKNGYKTIKMKDASRFDIYLYSKN